LKLATVKVEDAERVTVVLPSGGAVPLGEIPDGEGWPTDLVSLLEGGRFRDLRRRWDRLSETEMEDLSERAIPTSVVAGFTTVLDMTAEDIATVLNGEVRRKNTVSNMIFSPWSLVAFHSKVMTLLPGDVICTGTPGAVKIRDGDVAECRISSFEPLSNPVRR
jgi:hypothetical protein